MVVVLELAVQELTDALLNIGGSMLTDRWENTTWKCSMVSASLRIVVCHQAIKSLLLQVLTAAGSGSKLFLLQSCTPLSLFCKD
jgi:hypothetical protein